MSPCKDSIFSTLNGCLIPSVVNVLFHWFGSSVIRGGSVGVSKTRIGIVLEEGCTCEEFILPGLGTEREEEYIGMDICCEKT